MFELCVFLVYIYETTKRQRERSFPSSLLWSCLRADGLERHAACRSLNAMPKVECGSDYTVMIEMQKWCKESEERRRQQVIEQDWRVQEKQEAGAGDLERSRIKVH